MEIDGQIKQRKSNAFPETGLIVDVPVRHDDAEGTVEISLYAWGQESTTITAGAMLRPGKPQGKAVVGPKVKKAPGEKLLGGEALKDAEAAATKAVVERLRKQLTALNKTYEGEQVAQLVTDLRAELSAILKEAKG
jgi:hypothetical protein